MIIFSNKIFNTVLLFEHMLLFGQIRNINFGCYNYRVATKYDATFKIVAFIDACLRIL